MLVLVCFTVSMCFHASLNLAAIALERKCPDVVFYIFSCSCSLNSKLLKSHISFGWKSVQPVQVALRLHFISREAFTLTQANIHSA